MTKADEIIGIVHEIDELEREAERIRGRITVLREKLETASRMSHPVITQKPRIKRRRQGLMQARAIRYIQNNPKAAYADLVGAVYGSATQKNTFRTRSMIFTLKKRGVVIGDPGAWRVITPAPDTDTEDEAEPVQQVLGTNGSLRRTALGA